MVEAEGRGGERWRITRRTGVGLAGTVGFVFLAVLFEQLSRHTLVPNSDGASLVLEGRSMVRGHVLLQGWDLSLDSFWTSEVPLYALGYAVLGMNPVLLALVPAVLAALAVFVGLLVAVDGRSPSAAVAGGLVVLGVLALPTYRLSSLLVLGGAHIGAIACSLVAFYALRRGRWGPGVAVAAFVLAAGMLGDLISAAIGTAPIGIAAVLAMLRRRRVGAGLPALTAAVGAVVGSVLVRAAVVALGGFAINGVNARAGVHRMLINAMELPAQLAQLLGGRSVARRALSIPRVLEDVHIVSEILLAVCLLIVLVRLVAGVAGREPDSGLGSHGVAAERWWHSEPGFSLVDDMLAAACFGPMVVYCVLSTATAAPFQRYLTGSVVFLAVLAGRVVARGWERCRAATVRRGFAVVGIALLCLFASGTGFVMSSARPQQPAGGVAGWLDARHLTSGVGAYWASNILTVVSHGTVVVRPVIADPRQNLVRYARESDVRWYKKRHFKFLVYPSGVPWEGVDGTTAQATFGPATSIQKVGGFTVLVWAHGFRVPAEQGWPISGPVRNLFG